MSDNHPTHETFNQVTRNLAEPRRGHQPVSLNPMNSDSTYGTGVPLTGVHKRAPLVDYRPARLDDDYGDLDDPIFNRIKTSCLHIQNSKVQTQAGRSRCSTQRLRLRLPEPFQEPRKAGG